MKTKIIRTMQKMLVAALILLAQVTNAAQEQDPAQFELTNKYAIVSTIVTNTTAKWTTNWSAFIAEFQPAFDKGDLTPSDILDLAKRFHGHAVTWEGTISRPLTRGSVGISMPPAEIKYKVSSFGTTRMLPAIIDGITLTPEGFHSNAWVGAVSGQRVKFQTVLVGPALGPMLQGMGPNQGKLVILWKTKDAELLRSEAPSK